MAARVELEGREVDDGVMGFCLMGTDIGTIRRSQCDRLSALLNKVYVVLVRFHFDFRHGPWG